MLSLAPPKTFTVRSCGVDASHGRDDESWQTSGDDWPVLDRGIASFGCLFDFDVNLAVYSNLLLGHMERLY